MKIALSIDWDFFFNDIHMDWGHQENTFFINIIWNTRIIDLKLAGIEYEPKGIDDFLAKLKRLNIQIPALHVGESHLFALDFYKTFPPDLIVNFDSHPDMSPKHPEYLDCENWLYWLLKMRRKTRAVWVVPEHINPELFSDQLKNQRFSYVPYSEFESFWNRTFKVGDALIMGYMCRSGAWTPPWADEKFDALIKSLVSTKVLYHQDRKLEQRKITIPVEEEVARFKKFMQNRSVEK